MKLCSVVMCMVLYVASSSCADAIPKPHNIQDNEREERERCITSEQFLTVNSQKKQPWEITAAKLPEKPPARRRWCPCGHTPDDE